MADERKRFYKGSGIAKHREWRGLKDTFYDISSGWSTSASWRSLRPSPPCA